MQLHLVRCSDQAHVLYQIPFLNDPNRFFEIRLYTRILLIIRELDLTLRSEGAERILIREHLRLR